MDFLLRFVTGLLDCPNPCGRSPLWQLQTVARREGKDRDPMINLDKKPSSNMARDLALSYVMGVHRSREMPLRSPCKILSENRSLPEAMVQVSATQYTTMITVIN